MMWSKSFLKKQSLTNWLLLLSLAFSSGCGEIDPEQFVDQESDETLESESATKILSTSSTTKDGKTLPSQPRSAPFLGQLQVTGQLTDASHVTHVLGVNVESAEQVVGDLNPETGRFSLPLDHGEPWIITFIDAEQTGENMLLARLRSGQLDSIIVKKGIQEVNLGDVAIIENQKIAESSLSAEALAKALGLSQHEAGMLGVADDNATRYVNPDIDSSGVIDSEEFHQHKLEFTHRIAADFSPGVPVGMDIRKNRFSGPTTTYYRSGTTIKAKIPADTFARDVPADYVYQFSRNAKMGVECAEHAFGHVLTPEEQCTQASPTDSYNNFFDFGVELDKPIDGTYKLSVGEHAYSWNQVAIGAIKAAGGFLILNFRFDIDAKENLSGISYQWLYKTAGQYQVADDALVKLLVNSQGGGIAVNIDDQNSGKSVAFKIPPQGEGRVSIRSADTTLFGLSQDELYLGIAWERLQDNPSVGYTDVFGSMYFFE